MWQLYLKEKIDLVLFWQQMDEIDNLVKDLDSKNFNKIKELSTNLVEQKRGYYEQSIK